MSDAFLDPPSSKAARDADAGWQSLQFVAEALTDLLGFGIAAIDVRTDGEVRVAALAGVETGDSGEPGAPPRTLEELFGDNWPARRLEELQPVGEQWGRFVFAPHHLSPRAEAPETSTWHPDDVLVAPLHDGAGELIGCLWLDRPRDGRRPDAARRRLLDRYAEYAQMALRNAVDSQRLAERAHLLQESRAVVRMLSRTLTPQEVLDQAHQALAAAFRSDGVMIQTYAEGYGDVRASRPEGFDRDPRVAKVAARLIRDAWAHAEVAIIEPHLVHSDPRTAAHQEAILGWAERNEIQSAILAPIGVGDTAIGSIVVTRRRGREPWTSAELTTVRDLAADIGPLLLAGRAYRREQALATELRTLEPYKRDLITSISDVLTQPLSAIVGAVEAIDEHGPDPQLLAVAGRSSRRMTRAIDDLLMLSSVTDAEREGARGPVALETVVRRVVDLVQEVAAQAEVAITLSVDHDALPAVLASSRELERVVVNLVRNAITYTPAGGEVRIGLREAGDGVELTVADTGIGIEEADLPHVFEEFHRGRAAMAWPGSGLGLAIVARVVARHGGRVDVTSTPGQGSSFVVWLPRAAPED